MSNVNDYLLWRGDIPMSKEFPFNEIDSMILARFSYLIFNRIKMNAIETIESISLKMKDFPNDDFRYNGDKELITYLGVSNRFKDMVVTDFVESSDRTVEKQFGAITIHVSDKEMYISFIGTDASIVGWKEDFNLAFKDNIPAQFDGLKYTNEIAAKYPNKVMRIGGHSKGGNVAIYAAIATTEEIKNRIIKVYNYDGPGFNENIINKFNDEKIIKKTITYLPQDSVIGRILEHKEKCVVVQSTEKGIYQHDIYSWQVLGTKMIKLKKTTKSSDVICKTMKDISENTTPDQRRIFFDQVFEIFYSTSANTFGDISSNIIKNAPTLYKSYKGISEEDKRIINQMLKEFIKVYAANRKEAEPIKFEGFEELRNKISITKQKRLESKTQKQNDNSQKSESKSQILNI